MQAQSSSEAFDFEYIGAAKENWHIWGLAGFVLLLVLVGILWYRKKSKSDEKIPRITE